jgi:hypothetical protein
MDYAKGHLKIYLCIQLQSLAYKKAHKVAAAARYLKAFMRSPSNILKPRTLRQKYGEALYRNLGLRDIM